MNYIGNFFRSETDRKVSLDVFPNHINKFGARLYAPKTVEYVQPGQ